MIDNDNETRDAAARCIGEIIKAKAGNLAESALEAARLSIGFAMATVLQVPDSKTRSIVVLFSGEIPDDVANAITHFTEGTLQDLKTSGKIRLIHSEGGSNDAA